MDELADEGVGRPVRGIARRRLLALAGGAALAVGTGGLLAGCNGGNGDGGTDNGGTDNGGDGGGGDTSDNNGGGGGGTTGGGTSGGDDSGDDSGGGGGSDDGGDSDDARIRHQGRGTAPSGITA